jgi:hypothetical protein
MGAVAEIPLAFREQMARLMGLKFAPADMLTHWEALQDIPDDILGAAVSRAQKTRVEFPTPAELREDCDAVAHTVRPPAPEPDRGSDLEQPVTLGMLPDGRPVTAQRLWVYYHPECGDTGSESLWCGAPGPHTKPWQTVQDCGRRRPHDGHEWVRPCACAESNPALIRKRENQQKFADAAKTGKAK